MQISMLLVILTVNLPFSKYITETLYIYIYKLKVKIRGPLWKELCVKNCYSISRFSESVTNVTAYAWHLLIGKECWLFLVANSCLNGFAWILVVIAWIPFGAYTMIALRLW